jgi:hypothetical protein
VGVIVVAVVGGGDGGCGVAGAREVVLVVVAVWQFERSGRTTSKGDCAIFGSRDNQRQILGINFNSKLLLEK